MSKEGTSSYEQQVNANNNVNNANDSLSLEGPSKTPTLNQQQLQI